jgi:hypothetical protein
MNENIKTFRYKFSNEVESKMKDFSKVHVYDNKEQLISCFNEFWDNNLDMFMWEERRLINIGYSQNVKDGVYKSIKYYHIKRIRKENEKVGETKRKETGLKRRKMNPVLLKKIDNNLKYEIDCKKDDFKPSISFDLFIEKEEVKEIMDNDYDNFKKENVEMFESKEEEEIRNMYMSKMKKLYKNRYFKLTKK